MSYDTITVAPSTPHVGAEIGNIDLTKTGYRMFVKDAEHPMAA